jgi:hypothetical protein
VFAAFCHLFTPSERLAYNFYIILHTHVQSYLVHTRTVEWISLSMCSALYLLHFRCCFAVTFLSSTPNYMHCYNREFFMLNIVQDSSFFWTCSWHPRMLYDIVQVFEWSCLHAYVKESAWFELWSCYIRGSCRIFRIYTALSISVGVSVWPHSPYCAV